MTNFYNRIAHYYDAENAHFKADLPFYIDLAEQIGDPILDVGCGTGRVTFDLAGAGYHVVGVDNAPEMLKIAKRRQGLIGGLDELVEFVEADIMQYQSRQLFPLILLPYNALMHFTSQAEQIAALQHLKSLLRDDGLLVIDLPNAAEAYAADDYGALVLERTFTEPRQNHLVMQQSVSTLNRAEQILQVSWIYDEIQADYTLKRTVQPLTLRYVFQAELLLMLQTLSLVPNMIYGDYDCNPLEDGSERLIVIAGKH